MLKHFILLGSSLYLDFLPFHVLLVHCVPGRFVYPRDLPLVFSSHSTYSWVSMSTFVMSATKLTSSILTCPGEPSFLSFNHAYLTVYWTCKKNLIIWVTLERLLHFFNSFICNRIIVIIITSKRFSMRRK